MNPANPASTLPIPLTADHCLEKEMPIDQHLADHKDAAVHGAANFTAQYTQNATISQSTASQISIFMTMA